MLALMHIYGINSRKAIIVGWFTTRIHLLNAIHARMCSRVGGKKYVLEKWPLEIAVEDMFTSFYTEDVFAIFDITDGSTQIDISGVVPSEILGVAGL